jgi:hypothetical protein
MREERTWSLRLERKNFGVIKLSFVQRVAQSTLVLFLWDIISDVGGHVLVGQTEVAEIRVHGVPAGDESVAFHRSLSGECWNADEIL